MRAVAGVDDEGGGGEGVADEGAGTATVEGVCVDGVEGRCAVAGIVRYYVECKGGLSW